MASANGGSRRQAALIVQEQRLMTLRVPSFEPRSPYNLNAIPALWTLAIIAVVFLLRMPAVRAIVNGAAKQNNKMSAYILGVVNSAAFRMSGPETPAAKTLKAAESQQ